MGSFVTQDMCWAVQLVFWSLPNFTQLLGWTCEKENTPYSLEKGKEMHYTPKIALS